MDDQENPAVDRVLQSLDELTQRPVAEHVAVFEAAQEALRAALDDAGEAPGEASGSAADRPGPHG